MSVNIDKLSRELLDAGIPIHGVSSNGRVDYKDETTPAQRSQGAAIVAAHDPAPTFRQRLAARGVSYQVAALARVLRKGALAEQWAKDEVARIDREVDVA